MSTKIYEAYMLRDKRCLWPVCKKIRTRAEHNARKALRALYKVIIEDAKTTAGKDKDPYKSVRYAGDSYPATKTPLTILQASRFVKSQFAVQLTKYDRNEYDFSVSVTIREARDGRILLIPYSGSGFLSKSLRFMARMPELRDYHYQNSSDRPANTTARAWSERARTWAPLLTDDEWAHKLVLEVVSYSGFSRVDPAMADGVVW